MQQAKLDNEKRNKDETYKSINMNTILIKHKKKQNSDHESGKDEASNK